VPAPWRGIACLNYVSLATAIGPGASLGSCGGWLGRGLLARRRASILEGETSIAMLRGLVQIIAVGSILVILLRAPRWTGGLALLGMIVAAGATSARRAKGMPEAFRISAWAIAFAGSIIAS